jgi:hypothetical protein
MKTYLTKSEFHIPADYDIINPQQKSLYYGIPWIAPAAAILLNEILDGTQVALDLGLGGSTVFLGARCKKVVGVEVDTTGEWAPAMKAAVIDQELTNVDMIFVAPEPGGGADPAVVAAINGLTDTFDLISVDTYWPLNRELFLQTSISKLAENGILVLDNYGCGDLFRTTSGYSAKQFLEIYNLPNHKAYDFNQPGWSGMGTRLVVPKNAP